MRLSWGAIAQPGAPFGYGVIGDCLVGALANAGADISTTNPDYDLAIAVGLPMPWAIPTGTERDDLVWHTMFEATPFPQYWVEVINRSAGLWVPSQWVGEQFQEAGVTKPVMVSGYGVDVETFFHVPRQPRDKFKVVAWGKGLNSRKNLTLAMRAFILAGLPDDAYMEVKVNEDDPLARDGQVVEDENIHIIKRDWPQSVLANWLRSADVLIYMSSGEGFGLMPLEAMATGLPVICAANTGMLDYLTPENSLHVGCPTMIPATNYERIFGYSCSWYWPAVDEAIEHLRWAYHNRESLYEMGNKAAVDVAMRWTWQKAGSAALRELQTQFHYSRTYDLNAVTATLPSPHFTEV